MNRKIPSHPESVIDDDILSWKDNFHSHPHPTLKYVYNTEFGLFYKPIPVENFLLENEAYHCSKMRKKRLTFWYVQILLAPLNLNLVRLGFFIVLKMFIRSDVITFLKNVFG